MPQPFDADLPAYFADMGDVITYAAVTVNGLVDTHDERASGFGVELVDRILIVTVPYNAFPTPLAREAAVTVNGVAMVINEIMQKNDGGLTTFSAVLP